MEFKEFKNSTGKILKEYWITPSEWDALDKTTVQEGDIYHIVGTIDKGDLSADVNASLAKADSSLQKPTATLAKESFVKVGIDGTQKFDESSYVVAPSADGTAGQVLKKTATGTEWADESGGGGGDVTAAGNNVFTGYNSFKNGIYIKPNAGSPELNTFCGINKSGLLVYTSDSRLTSTKTISVPMKEGTLALTSDIDVKAAGNNTFTGNNTFKGEVIIGTEPTSGQQTPPSPYTKLLNNSISVVNDVDATIAKIEPNQFYVNMGAGESATYTGNKIIYSSGGVDLTLNFPTNSGVTSATKTLATLSDIPIKSASLDGTTLNITLA